VDLGNEVVPAAFQASLQVVVQPLVCIGVIVERLVLAVSFAHAFLVIHSCLFSQLASGGGVVEGPIETLLVEWRGRASCVAPLQWDVVRLNAWDFRDRPFSNGTELVLKVLILGCWLLLDERLRVK